MGPSIFTPKLDFKPVFSRVIHDKPQGRRRDRTSVDYEKRDLQRFKRWVTKEQKFQELDILIVFHVVRSNTGYRGVTNRTKQTYNE